MPASRKNSAPVRAPSKPTPPGRRLIAQEIVADGKFEPAIDRLFAHAAVNYIQVHSTTAGCFTFRIERC
jgi:hypothetical protein